MRRKLIIVFIILCSLVFIGHSQSFMSFGWSVEKMDKTEPFRKIIDDFNNHYSNNYIMTSSLKVPEILNGGVFGFKFDGKVASVGLGFHTHLHVSTAEWADSSGNEYITQLRLNHHGFTYWFGANIVHSDGFRMGPVFGMNFEQFRTKLRDSKDFIYAHPVYPVDIFYFSFTFKFPFSFGNEDFTFDIIPYYQLPLYNMKLSKLHDKLNVGHATPYTKDELKFNPASYGIILTLNFPFKL